MIWMALTGGIASGKTTVAGFFSDAGVTVVSADKLAHDAIAPGSPGATDVRRVFGDGVFDEAGQVDRAKLGALIFADGTGNLKRQLEAIIHPQVRRQSEFERKRLEARGDEIAVYEIPLLFEKNLIAEFDSIITVAISSELQVERLMARSGLTKEQAYARIQAQFPQDQKIQGADFVIWNDGDLKRLRDQTEQIVASLRTTPPHGRRR